MAVEAQATSLLIRRARHDDLARLELFIAPFAARGEVLPRTLAELTDLLSTFFIAEQHDALVGCAALEIYSWKLAEVRSLCVAEHARGHGVGRALVRACVALAEERNILEVMAITASEEFFRGCGFDFTLPGQKKALFYQSGSDT